MVRTAVFCALVALCAGGATTASGQEPEPSTKELLNELRRLSERVETLETRHESDQLRINELEERLQKVETTQADQAAPAGQPEGTPAGAEQELEALLKTGTMRPAPQDQSVLDRAVAKLVPTPPSSAHPAPPTAYPSSDLISKQVGGANLRLLDVSFDVLWAAGGSTATDRELQNLEGGDHDPRKRGFTIQNTELSLSAAVDPYFTGHSHIVYLIDPVTGESRLELEEAYLVTETLPYNLQFKAGQFFTEFGRINPRHPHQWAWMDQPVINSRLFGPDGMRGQGFRLSWSAPLPWFSELNFGMQNANGETMASFLSSDELAKERAIGRRPFVEGSVNDLSDFAYLLRWENGFDLTSQLSANVGLSGLLGPNSTGPHGRTMIYGADFVLKWRPERNQRGWPFVLWESEIMKRDYKADSFPDAMTILADKTLEDWGFYSQVLYGFTPGWDAGARFEYASGSGGSVGGRENDPFRDDRFRVSPLVQWHPSEFSRLRLQYNYDRADHLADGNAHSVWFGFEYGIGAHAAHKY